VTEAGELLLRHVRTITDRLQAARADLAAYAAGETGTLRVGIYQSVGARILPAIIGRFAEEWPRVNVQLFEAASDQGLLEFVEPGRLDVSFGVLPLPPGPFEAVELLSDPFVLVTAARSPLAATTGLPSLRLIAEQRLIGFRSCRSTRWAEEYLRERGEQPNFVFRSEDNGTVQAMAGAGLGAALVPFLAVDPTDPAVTVIPTDLPARRIALIWHADRYRSPASRAFVEISKAVCAEFGTSLAAVRRTSPSPSAAATPAVA
jgi:DNA-binding transcriptional LysR family regulator